jgi:hypothetical protein
MRLAVISDVHGNLPALEAVVADIKKRQVDSTVNDLAPKFYPAVSSLLAFGLPCWAVGATGAGAEPLA